MLVVSLIASTVLLFLAWRAARKSPFPALVIPAWSILFGLGPAFCLLLPAVIAQGFFLSIGSLFLMRKPAPRRFWPVAVIATVAGYVAGAAYVYRDLLDLRQQYPIESMETRAPIRAWGDAVHLDAESTVEIEFLESWIENSSSWFRRDRYLESLHENTLDTFLGQPGFGVARLNGFEILRARARERKSNSTPLLEGHELTEAMSAGAQADDLHEIRNREKDLRMLHRDRLPEFFDKGLTFGVFRDRRHVIGFEPHGFGLSRDEPPAKRTRTQLVGLVVHPEPVVYMTADIPNMAEVGRLPMRPLDAFETQGLKSLRDGASLFARGNGDRVRMLGPIRATKQCVECHGCERGQLLGAFSYVLDGPPKTP